jgi:para-nitrobenzyl esterase
MTLRVTTPAGSIEGVVRSDHAAFLGIPFAAAPVGKLRFCPPEKLPAWSGVHQASRFRPPAPQGAAFAPGVRIEGPASEDCLYLNVFTPSADARPRPVLFWIHGGAFTVGTAGIPLYDGGALASLGDVVVVTANYRIGALGFLALGADGAPWGAHANLGLLDQVAALRWVRENIASFGGDPDNVTVFGESAGGTSVCLLMVMEEARGLFRRAIVQSGTGPLALPSVEQAAPVTERFLRTLGISRRESERLRSVPLLELMRAQALLEEDGQGWPHFYPVLDGETFREQPADSIRAGGTAHIPLLTGSNRDEWNLFAANDVAAWGKPLELEAALVHLRGKLPAVASANGERLFEAYRASRSALGLPHDTRALLRAIEGDLRFGLPTLRFAEAHASAGGATFMYLFTYASPGLRGALGACHALELPFVFGTLSAPGQERFAGSGASVQALSHAMMQAWISFARSGDPSDSPLSPWDAFDTRERATMRIDLQSEQVHAPFAEERAGWRVQ